MNSLWHDAEAQAFADDPLQMRVYTSRLLGRDPSLVLHGGGNTSVKITMQTFLGETADILYVKGSGHDLATIDAAGFAPVRMDVLLKLVEREQMRDSVLVREQRAAMIDPYAPDPSIEAILHAIIPFKYVDHTHADAIVAISNTPDGRAHLERIYGSDVLILPYVMAGFTLAREVYRLTQGADWSRLRGIVLMNHGVFTFADDARQSYENMIALVTEAEGYLKAQGAWDAVAHADAAAPPDLEALSRLRKIVSDAAGRPMIAQISTDPESRGFAGLENAAALATRGPLTPDHVIRSRHVAAIIERDDDLEGAVTAFEEAYRQYFARNNDGTLVMLDPAPRWAVWRGRGIVAFGHTIKMAAVITDIVRHTIRAIQWAEALSAWQPLSEDHTFDMEYWELQQAKLKRMGAPPPLAGRIALVTNAAAGIGEACVAALSAAGAAVVALDDDPGIADRYGGDMIMGITCDVHDAEALSAAVDAAVARYGGLDVVVSSSPDAVRRSLPYLRHGIDPAVTLINPADETIVPELAQAGIRVAVLHPGAGRDAATPADVAAVVCALTGSAFGGVEEAQIVLKGMLPSPQQ